MSACPKSKVRTLTKSNANVDKAAVEGIVRSVSINGSPGKLGIHLRLKLHFARRSVLQVGGIQYETRRRPDLPSLDHIVALRANMQQNQPKKKMMNKDSLEALVHSRTKGVSRPKLLPRDLNSRMNPLITPIKSNARKSLDELSSPAYFPSNR